MGVILVGKNNPRERLYLENLGIHTETAEELSYLILKYPSLFPESLVGETFFAFVERGALQPALARELQSYRGEDAQSEEILARFLARSSYANPRQQSMFLQDAKEYLALPRGRAELKWGDLFFSPRKYGKAVDAYERALTDDKLDHATKSRLLDREGAALANLFLSERTLDCFQEAYTLRRDRNTIKRMYFLAETETNEALKARFRRELSEMRDSEKARWGEQLRKVTSRGAAGREAKEVADISTEQNKTKRRAHEEKVIVQWREEYRSMV